MNLPDRRDIIVFGAPWCGDCRTSKEALERHRVLFEYRDIEVDPEARKEFNKLIGDGPKSIPQILFRVSDASGNMAVVQTLVEPSPWELTQALRNHGFLPLEQGDTNSA